MKKLLEKIKAFIVTMTGTPTLDLPNSTNSAKNAEKKSMYRNITKEEMMEMLNKNIDEGYVKDVGDEHYSLTNKGMGQLAQYLYDFVDVMLEVDAYKDYPQSYLLQVAMESMQQTFGSKLQAFLIMHNTDWKDDLKKQLEMPFDELLRELGLTENEIAEMTKGTNKKQETPKYETSGNLIILDKNKKNDTIH